MFVFVLCVYYDLTNANPTQRNNITDSASCNTDNEWKYYYRASRKTTRIRGYHFG